MFAATGTFVNITDPVTANKARVNSSGALWTTMIDPTTKSQAKVTGGKVGVGDGSGALTVDGKVDVGNVAPRTPFAIQLVAPGTSNAIGSKIQPVFTVPAGKTLVIETVTVGVLLPDGEQPARVGINVTTRGVDVFHYLQFLYQNTFGGYQDEFVGTHAVRLYADAGTTVSVEASKNGSGTGWHGRFAVSGYLV